MEFSSNCRVSLIKDNNRKIVAAAIQVSWSVWSTNGQSAKIEAEICNMQANLRRKLGGSVARRAGRGQPAAINMYRSRPATNIHGPILESSHTSKAKIRIKAASTSMSNFAPNEEVSPRVLATIPSNPSRRVAETAKAIRIHRPVSVIRWRDPMVEAKSAVIMSRTKVMQLAGPNLKGCCLLARRNIIASAAMT